MNFKSFGVFLTLSFAVFSQESGLWEGVTDFSRYDLIPVTGFETPGEWIIDSDTVVDSYGRFSSNIPRFGDKANPLQQKLEAIFNEDLDLLGKAAKAHSRGWVAREEHSLELRVYISRPGRERILLKPREPYVIRGRPRACAFWVSGAKKKHRLSLLVSAPGIQPREIPVSSLNYSGWERFEIPVPVFLQRRNSRHENRYEFTIEGIVLTSHAKEQPGVVLFNVDLLSCLVDRSEDFVPGAQIHDDWE